MVLTEQNIIDLTHYVNSYRAQNQAPPLVWDGVISSFSQTWSNYMMNTNLFKHSSNPLYGENIAYFSGYGTDVMTLSKLAIDNWYNEISLYNFNKPGYSDATGHFTCLVWLKSTSFGMGISINANGEAFITLNTSTPGNIIGQFQQNVLPLVSGIPLPTPTPTPIPKTTNKQIVLMQLLSVINQVNEHRSPIIIIQNIHKIIHEIQDSSPF